MDLHIGVRNRFDFSAWGVLQGVIYVAKTAREIKREKREQIVKVINKITRIYHQWLLQAKRVKCSRYIDKVLITSYHFASIMNPFTSSTLISTFLIQNESEQNLNNNSSMYLNNKLCMSWAIPVSSYIIIHRHEEYISAEHAG